ncbi:uncharacterized protein [Prorops nasuta]
MRVPLLQRIRITEALWICGFCFGSICYLVSSKFQSLQFFNEKWDLSHQDVGIALHKSFYFHCACTEALSHNAWIKSWSNVLFTSFVLTLNHQKWCPGINNFLLYKALDTVLINCSRILQCLSQNSGRKLARLLFVLHCLNWIYLYLFFVPKYILFLYTKNYLQIELGLWLWFGMECIDCIWLKLFKNFHSPNWFEICLFPPLTDEAFELQNIWKKHRESLKKAAIKKSDKKSELWLPLLCAMVMKKKIRQIRRQKHSESEEAVEDCGDNHESIGAEERNVDEGNSKKLDLNEKIQIEEVEVEEEEEEEEEEDEGEEEL